MLGTSPLRACLFLELAYFRSGKEPASGFRPSEEQGFLALYFKMVGFERVFPYRAFREFVERLLRANCDLDSSSDKLCGAGLMWPKSGGVAAGASLH